MFVLTTKLNRSRILIIKLEAVGDVLRTTCILHGLKEKYPKSEITWITCKSAVPLFRKQQAGGSRFRL